MQNPVTLQQFFEAYQKRLALRWLTKHHGKQSPLTPCDDDEGGLSLVGHLNLIHPHTIQILGRSELEYLDSLGKNSRHDTLAQLCSAPTQLLVIAAAAAVPEELLQMAKRTATPLCASPYSSHRLVRDIDYYLRGLLADILVVHGVFMEVMGIGVLLTGESAIGKSELALELISRGHRLVADDAPAFQRRGPETLIGHCPRALENFLEVRGLGIMNIRELFGDNALRPEMKLHLIAQLTPIDAERSEPLDRLRGSRRLHTLLDVAIPEVEIPIAPGRNLAVLVEAAARNQILYNRGYDAAEDFIARQQRLIDHEQQ
ncbi:MAG: HPr(Ser) kinase/phosphatase [Chromatiales bacterium]|nr:HPr(Ser) kinase/phosphatase [Chromatiales bacterium]